jgi:plasmid stability protein
MDIDNMDIEDVKAELEVAGVKLHHKTGEAKYRQVLSEVVAGTYNNKPDNTPPVAVSSPTELTVEQKAMKLSRIVVSPNDPLQSTYTGLIFTVSSSIINRGKAIKKFVPFNNDEGWHVPNILVKQIQNAEMQKFKTIKAANGEKQLVPYITKKYNVQTLPDLTQPELDKLADQQKARGDT